MPGTEERCRHELLIRDCAWCSPVSTAFAPRFHAPADVQRDAAGPVVAARFEGHCPVCHDRIDEGDEIRMLDGRAVHDGCEVEL